MNNLTTRSLLLLLACSPLAAEPDFALIDDYCSGCHNTEDFSGSLAFELVEREQLPADAAVWEQVIRKLKSGMMPPPDNKRPDDARVHAFVVALEDTLDAHARANPSPGASLLRRLNRTEYNNAIRDLLDLQVDTTGMMPADDSSAGFDNMANVLSISPVLLESYVSTAAKVSRLAVGDLDTVASSTSYRADGQSQAMQKVGLALGTRGGISADHVFELDAEYEITVGRSGAAVAFSLTPFGTEDPVELVVDGERVALLQPRDRGTLRLALPAGLHRIEAAYLPRASGLGVDDLHTEWASSTAITNLSIRGPLSPSGRGDTASRRKIFTCYPDSTAGEPICAGEILRNLATRAYRRPVDDASLEVLMDFYRNGREKADFDTGIQYALSRLLVDPRFIFRLEAEPPGLAAGSEYRVDDYELASRLSFFLWSSIPDATLLDLAGQGSLSQPEFLRAQVARMLADPKAVTLETNFASQWLSLNKLASVNPVSAHFDNALRQAMLQETRLLFAEVQKRDASIIDFLDADYTFVNERLARHYGLPGIRGSHFRKVTLPDGQRRGLLGHASILTLTSAPNRTSPVMRGTWIMENLLAAAPPEPPPGVETNLEASVPGAITLSVREQLERHRADPACSACHNFIDPLGFALENFDAIGMWRNESGGEKVDSVSRLWDGTELAGPEGLHTALLQRRDLFVEAFVEKMLTYALGRRIEYFDMPTVREIVRKAEAAEYRLSAIVQGIVEAPAFATRMAEGSEQVEPALVGMTRQD
jgi:hypothetical protein